MTKEQIQNEAAVVDTDTMHVRREKLKAMRQNGQAYPNDFRRDALAAGLHTKYDSIATEPLKAQAVKVAVAGRIILRRIMGKAAFMQIQDMSGQIQIYCRQEELSENFYEEVKKWDLGDIIGVTGTLFKTKTNELTIHAQSLTLICKSLRPMPDKFHGLHDSEMRYRQRYLDLIANEKARKTFMIRSQLIQGIREFLTKINFLEVETPMMHALAGGALARPFTTHHNALKMDLFLRIAPELHLKRLLVGGFERVFEINRCFRNEGLSTQHNPEFTTLEFYQAYADYEQLMQTTEEMFRFLAQNILGTTQITYQGIEIDFAKPFARLSVREAILQYNPQVEPKQLETLKSARAVADNLAIVYKDTDGLGKVLIEIFEKTVEHELLQPTFITEYPVEVSPLARKNNTNPDVVDRFELFIAGKEIANGFSELNDPDDQAERFSHQAKQKAGGDLESMPFDEEYILALEYGMPPAAGEGIGIDRLAMIFTDSPTIRDVILFPLLKAAHDA